VDLDKRAVDRAVSQGLKVHWATIETAGLARESYDLIFMIMTIEHVEKPDEVLRAAYNLLRKSGSLVIVTDNTDSVDFRIFKRGYWGGYHFPRHWNLFNRHSLSKLSEKTGFKVRKFKTIVSPVNWVYSIHNILVDKNKSTWLVNRFSLKSIVSLGFFTVIDFILQKFGKGSILQATLEKP
jgi:SAM-dependent methyltransferase